jgi:hypothetical protein
MDQLALLARICLEHCARSTIHCQLSKVAVRFCLAFVIRSIIFSNDTRQWNPVLTSCGQQEDPKASRPCDPFVLPFQLARISSLAEAVRFLGVVLPDQGSLSCCLEEGSKPRIEHCFKSDVPADSLEVLSPMDCSLEEIGSMQAKHNPSLQWGPFCKFLCEGPKNMSFSVNDRMSANDLSPSCAALTLKSTELQNRVDLCCFSCGDNHALLSSLAFAFGTWTRCLPFLSCSAQR